MPWSLYLALKQLFPTGKKISFFAIMATIGVALGVMILIIVMSVMNGFGHQIQETFNKLGGDVVISSHEGVLHNWEEVMEKVEQNKFVVAASPFAEGMVMMQYRNQPVFPGVRGIEGPKEVNVVRLNEFITEGVLEDLDDESVIIGNELFKALGLKVGDTVDVYTPLMMQRMKESEVILPRELKVIGEVHTNMSQLDSNFIIVTLRTMQDLYGLGKGVLGITVKVDLKMKVEEATALLRKQLPESLKVNNWMEANEPFLFVLRMEKAMMFFIILFVVLVASFSITSSLMATVVKKTREIGLLCAMGATAPSVAGVFCLQGLLIGIVGTALGVVGAFLGIGYRNDMVHSLMRILDRETVIARFYQFADIPARYEVSDFVVIISFSILIAMCAGLLPAMRAARLKPSEALRSE